MPIGTAITVATPVITSVPTIAWAAPPPAPTTLRCVAVKNVPSKRARPLPTTVTSSDASGVRASTKAAVTVWVTARSVAARGLSTARDHAQTTTPDTTAAATSATPGATDVVRTTVTARATRAPGTPAGTQRGRARRLVRARVVEPGERPKRGPPRVVVCVLMPAACGR